RTRTRNNAARNCACRAPRLIARPALLRSAAVVRFRLWLATAFALGVIVGSVLRAQVSDEETGRGEQSVKKRHKAHSFSPAPEKSPSPIAKAKPVSSKSKEETDTSPAAEKSPSPIAKAAKKSGEEETVPKSKPSETPEPTVASAKHKKSPSATPKASPHTKVLLAVAADDRGQVVIEKSDFEKDQGLEPAPTPPPSRFGFWPGSRSRSSESYRYLTRSVIEQIRRAPVQRGRWEFIVVHNSGTRQGNARAFDYYHRHVRRMQNGLAYHFVIGNGTSTGNGQIEVGDRWRRQINGGHV